MRFTVRKCGFLGLGGGVLFALYALTKTSLATAAVANGWSTPVTTATETAWLVHLFETVPVALLFVALVGYAASRWDAIGTVGRFGTWIAVFGFVAVAVTHACEHTIAGPPLDGLPGEGDVFVYGYLFAWEVLGWGEVVLGLETIRLDGAVSLTAAVLVGSLPVALVGGFAAVGTGAYTFAGVNRLVQAAVSIVVGWSLWSERSAVATPDASVRS